MVESNRNRTPKGWSELPIEVQNEFRLRTTPSEDEMPAPVLKPEVKKTQTTAPSVNQAPIVVKNMDEVSSLFSGWYFSSNWSNETEGEASRELKEHLEVYRPLFRNETKTSLKYKDVNNPSKEKVLIYDYNWSEYGDSFKLRLIENNNQFGIDFIEDKDGQSSLQIRIPEGTFTIRKVGDKYAVSKEQKTTNHHEVLGALVSEPNYTDWTWEKGTNPVQKKDKAMHSSTSNLSNTGGIDFNSDKMNLETRNSGGEMTFHLDPAQLAQLRNVPGFTPVIINIQPMIDLRGFLGLNAVDSSAVVS
ncbi:MAG: hypothetical protein HQL15_10375 [Candidatus Omnitrophica bacterium]|nr:hypothetical protein [Candidatus Omnitrophota bacterium]